MKKKNKEREEVSKVWQIIAFIIVVVILFGALSISVIDNFNINENKTDFCLYKNYTSYQGNHCYKVFQDILIQSPQIVTCNSPSGYCFKYVQIRE